MQAKKALKRLICFAKSSDIGGNPFLDPKNLGTEGYGARRKRHARTTAKVDRDGQKKEADTFLIGSP